MKKSTIETRNSSGQLHSFNDIPAQVWDNGYKYWYKNSKLHRETKPAIVYTDGTQTWVWEGKLIR